jgi:hypothetical protein
MSCTKYHGGMPGSDHLPPFARACPDCGYDLTGSIDAGRDRCPECGMSFTIDELLMVHLSNGEGEPRSISPHEWTIRGSRLFLICGLALFAILLIMLMLEMA